MDGSTEVIGLINNIPPVICFNERRIIADIESIQLTHAEGKEIIQLRIA